MHSKFEKKSELFFKMSIYVPSIQENSKLGICDGLTVRNRIVTFFVIKNYRKSVTTYPWERDVLTSAVIFGPQKAKKMRKCHQDDIRDFTHCSSLQNDDISSKMTLLL